ncbi:MAG: hypothetical protein ACREJV_12180, partial [Candidatus Rokuibacteriota bacterium]
PTSVAPSSAGPATWPWPKSLRASSRPGVPGPRPDPQLRAFITLDAEGARATAKERGAELASGRRRVGRPFGEATVLRVGRAWEQLLGGFTRPPLP